MFLVRWLSAHLRKRGRQSKTGSSLGRCTVRAPEMSTDGSREALLRRCVPRAETWKAVVLRSEGGKGKPPSGGTVGTDRLSEGFLRGRGEQAVRRRSRGPSGARGAVGGGESMPAFENSIDGLQTLVWSYFPPTLDFGRGREVKPW
jgi:hypothetical protein